MQQPIHNRTGQQSSCRTRIYFGTQAEVTDCPASIQRVATHLPIVRLAMASALPFLLSLLVFATMIPIPLYSAAAHQPTADILRAPYAEQINVVSSADVLRGPYEFPAATEQMTIADALRGPYN